MNGLRWALVAMFALGCVAKTTDVGGETHWLAHCDRDAECGAGLSCECGRCTTACESSSACSDLGAAAVCLSTPQVDFAADCDEPPQRLCARSSDVTDAATPSTEPSSDVTEPGPANSEPTAPTTEPTEPVADLPDADVPASVPSVTDSGSGSETDPCNDPSYEYLCQGADCCVGADFVCEPGQVGFDSECGCGCVTEGSDGARVVVYAQRFDANADCGTGRAGTIAYGSSCGEIELNAIDQDGVCWRLPNGCLPTGLNALDDPTACAPCDTEQHALQGMPFDEVRGCFSTPAVEAGSTSATTCDDALTVALAQDGSCWLFTSSCIPDGFIDERSAPEIARACATAGMCSDTPTTCAERSLQDCNLAAGCAPISGAMFEPEAACFEPNTPLGCADAELSCDPSITYALDADDRCWRFGGCVPSGYVTTSTAACVSADEEQCETP